MGNTKPKTENMKWKTQHRKQKTASFFEGGDKLAKLGMILIPNFGKRGVISNPKIPLQIFAIGNVNLVWFREKQFLVKAQARFPK